MRYITIDKLKPGMILSRGVYDFQERVLVAEGKELNLFLIKRLELLGYPGLYIEDEISKDIRIQEAISAELRRSAVHSLQNMDMDAAIKASERIVEQIMNRPTVSLDMVDLRTFDDYTYRHSVNVAVLSLVIATGLGYSHEEMIDLSVAAIFHDLGKLFIDKSILNKAGKLNPMEVEIIRQHPRFSFDLLNGKWNIPARVKAGVLCHHENEDGSGYPKGLKGKRIHRFAKIIHVADVYDALSSKRPYKEACSFSESLEYLMGGCGTMFDFHVVQAFLKYVPVYPKGITVELSDGQEAIVVENYPENQLRPKVRLMDGVTLDLRDMDKYRNLTVFRQAGTNAIAAAGIERNEKARGKERYHVLVIEQNSDSMVEINQILEKYYRLTLTDSFTLARNTVYEKMVDAIVLDMDIPSKKAIDAIKEMTSAFQEQIPLVLITAQKSTQVILESNGVDADEYVDKPLNRKSLLYSVQHVLGEL